MLLIHCPYCGEERPELEFRNAGEAHIARPADIAAIGDDDFEKFFFIRSNPKGIVFERWRHMHGCGRFFNAVRDSVTDRFFTTYKAGEKKPDPARFAARAGPPAETVEAPAPAVPKAPKPVAKQAKEAKSAAKGSSRSTSTRKPSGKGSA